MPSGSPCVPLSGSPSLVVLPNQRLPVANLAFGRRSFFGVRRLRGCRIAG
jgi:hypothetical protein